VRLLPFELDWVRTITRALLPPHVLGGALDGLDAAPAFDRDMARSPWFAALGLRLSLWLTWLAPVWLLGHAQTFGAVDAATQIEILERLFKHSSYVVRMAAMLLKLTLCTVALGDERVLRQLGAYDLARAAARSAS
jgi:hypothetical protein